MKEVKTEVGTNNSMLRGVCFFLPLLVVFGGLVDSAGLLEVSCGLVYVIC